MKMIDLYLKTDNESDMNTALTVAGFTEEESGRLYHLAAALDVIGTIYQPTGELTVLEGIEVPVLAPVPGYHVNVRTQSAELAQSLDAYRTYPETPVRVWA